MILLALVSTFIALHNFVFGLFAFDEKMDLEDRIKGRGKYKDDYEY